MQKKFLTDYQIQHQLNVLKAIGVTIEFIFEYKNNELNILIKKIEFLDSFFRANKIINKPQINVSGFQISDIESFELQQPSKTLLAESAINSGFSPSSSNFDTIIINIYKQSIQNTLQKEKQLKEEYTNILNQNLLFLQEAVSTFCSIHTRSEK